MREARTTATRSPARSPRSPRARTRTIGTGAFPRQHGITGHNIRDGAEVRKAYGSAARRTPATSSSRRSRTCGASDGDRAWVGEIGYQVWHLGMIGVRRHASRSGRRPAGRRLLGRGRRPAGLAAPRTPSSTGCRRRCPALEVVRGATGRRSYRPRLATAQFDPVKPKQRCTAARRRSLRYQGDLIEATLADEPIGHGRGRACSTPTTRRPTTPATSTACSTRMDGRRRSATVDEQLGRLVAHARRPVPGRYALIVTADHGQCPLPDAAGGVRLDPIQLGTMIEQEFGGGPRRPRAERRAVRGLPGRRRAVGRRRDARRRRGVPAATPLPAEHRSVRAPRARSSRSSSTAQQFAAVFATTFLDTLGDRGPRPAFGTAYLSRGARSAIPAPV